MSEWLRTLLRWTLRWVLFGSSIRTLTSCIIPAGFAHPPQFFLSRILLGAIVGGSVGISGGAIEIAVRHRREWRVFVLAGLILLASAATIIWLFWEVWSYPLQPSRSSSRPGAPNLCRLAEKTNGVTSGRVTAENEPPSGSS
jgi:hypothetical protein